jgi:hypothetical protein
VKINIVGAGQSGLQLALGLLKHGYEVRLYSDRTPEQIYAGSVMSTQCMFDSALQTERDLNLNLWDEACPDIEGIMVRIATPDGQLDGVFGNVIAGKPEIGIAMTSGYDAF